MHTAIIATLDPSNIQVNETVGAVSVCVRLNERQRARNVTVTVSTQDGTALGTHIASSSY